MQPIPQSQAAQAGPSAPVAACRADEYMMEIIPGYKPKGQDGLNSLMAMWRADTPEKREACLKAFNALTEDNIKKRGVVVVGVSDVAMLLPHRFQLVAADETATRRSTHLQRAHPQLTAGHPHVGRRHGRVLAVLSRLFRHSAADFRQPSPGLRYPSCLGEHAWGFPHGWGDAVVGEGIRV